MLGLITSLGSSAAAVFVVIYFLGYLKSLDERVATREKARDDQWSTTVKDMFDHLETVTADKGIVLRETAIAMHDVQEAISRQTVILEALLKKVQP